MKLLISSDIEGTAGIVHWHETYAGPDERWYQYFCTQMSREVAAACEGAMKGGATDILVKDAHNTARNIDPSLLPTAVKINRGWSGGLLSMADGLTKEYDALAFTGYHTHSRSGGNPLAHTMSTEVVEMQINGVRVSEFTIHSYVAGMLGVPVVFVSGDEALCKHAKAFLPGITAVAVTAGEGDSATSVHPDMAVEMIREGMCRALSGARQGCRVKMPDNFKVEVCYRNHARAYSKAFYPGAQQKDEHTIVFENKNYYEILRFFHFVL